MHVCSCAGKKSPKEIKVTLPTGITYTPDIDILQDGTVTLQLYGNQKTLFWSDVASLYKESGSWEQFPLINASYQGIDYRLRFLWRQFIPGSGLYPFAQVES